MGCGAVLSGSCLLIFQKMLHPSTALKMKAAHSLKALLNFCRTAWHDIQESIYLHYHVIRIRTSNFTFNVMFVLTVIIYMSCDSLFFITTSTSILHTSWLFCCVAWQLGASQLTASTSRVKRWRHCIPLIWFYPLTRLHCVMTQKITMWIFTAVKTSNLL